MLVHFILFAAVFASFSKYKEKPLFLMSFFILGGFAALRYQYGNDYNSYMAAYNRIHKGIGDPFDNEVAYTLLNKLMPSFFLIVVVTSIFFVFVIYRLINSNLRAPYKSLAVFILIINPYLFLMNLSAIRQCLALCIFIVSLKYIQERKPIKYSLLILLATAFHASAALLFPIYFVSSDKKMNKSQTAVLIVLVLVMFLENALIDEMIRAGLGFFDNSDYNYYFEEAASNSLRATILTGFYFVYVAINLKNLEGYKLICGKLYLIGLIFGMFAFYYSMLTRVQMYFDIFSIIALPSIIEYHVKNRGSKWSRTIQLYVFPLLLLLIYVLRYYSFFTNPMWGRFGTYHTIFEALL